MPNPTPDNLWLSGFFCAGANKRTGGEGCFIDIFDGTHQIIL